MSHTTLKRGFNKIRITNGILICTDPKQAQDSDQPVYIIPNLTPTDLRLHLKFNSSVLHIMTQSNTRLTWFDEPTGRNSIQDSYRLCIDDTTGSYRFPATLKDQNQKVVVNLKILVKRDNYVLIFIEFCE